MLSTLCISVSFLAVAVAILLFLSTPAGAQHPSAGEPPQPAKTTLNAAANAAPGPIAQPEIASQYPATVAEVAERL